MFNLSSCWSRKIPGRRGCVSFLHNFSNKPTLLHAEFYGLFGSLKKKGGVEEFNFLIWKFFKEGRGRV